AADAAALEASDRGAEAQRFHLAPSLRQRQREPAVQSVAGGKRIDGANFEHRQAADRTVLQIENVVWTIADRQERIRMLCDLLETVAKIDPAGRGRQALRGKNRMGGDAEKRIVDSCGL